MSTQRKLSHDYPREERIAGMRAILDFLEANPDFDIPEGVDEFYLRTLPRQNRGELVNKTDVAAWFRKHLEMLKPDRTYSGTDFGGIREFGGGAQIVIQVSASEVCSKETTSSIVHRPTTVEETTWHCPQELIGLGFAPDQAKLREQDNSYRAILSGTGRSASLLIPSDVVET